MSERRVCRREKGRVCERGEGEGKREGGEREKGKEGGKG